MTELTLKTEMKVKDHNDFEFYIENYPGGHTNNGGLDMTFNFLDENRLDAVKVQFKAEIFEDDFPERGMTAWLTKIEKCPKTDGYELHFDFEEFESHNEKYFTECYHPNIHTKNYPTKPLYTAKEAGCYNHKYSVYFGDMSWSADKFNEELSKYLKVVEV